MSQIAAKNPVYIWSGCYATWNEACAAAQAQAADDTFRTDRWKDRITRQLLDYRKEYLQYGVAMPPRPCSLPLVLGLNPARSIIDLGGSSGWCWDYLNNTLPENWVSSYIVVELAEVANYMEAGGFHRAPVQYRTLVDDLVPCDLLYSNSVLQYFESNEALLELVNKTTPQRILLEDVLAHGGEDFFTTQPYYGSAIPYRIVGLRQLRVSCHGLGTARFFRHPMLRPCMA